MAGKNGPHTEASQKNAAQEVTDLSSPQSEDHASFREQFRQSSPSHTGERIAENHERLQNAGFEDVASQQSARRNTGTAGQGGVDARRRENEVFADQQRGEGVGLMKKRRSRRSRSSIPEYISQLVDLLESSMSAAQVQEVLEQAIEDHAAQSALQVSAGELQATAEAIFEQIRLALANGDLAQQEQFPVPEEESEIDRKLLRKQLSEFFLEYIGPHQSAETPWITDLIRQIALHEREYFATGDLSSHPYYLVLLHATHELELILALEPELLEDGEALQEKLSGLLPDSFTLGALLAQEGPEKILEELSMLCERELEAVTSPEEGMTAAKALIRATLASEMRPVLQDIAQQELIAECEGGECRQRQEVFAQAKGLFDVFPGLAAEIEQSLDQWKGELRRDVEKDLVPLLHLSDALHEICSDEQTAVDPTPLISLLTELSPELLSVLDPVVASRTGATLEELIAKVYPDGAAVIAHGLRTGDLDTMLALRARRDGMRVEELAALKENGTGTFGTTGISRRWGVAEAETAKRALARYLELIEDEGVLHRYEELFGSASTAPAALLPAREARIVEAQLRGLRTGNAAVPYAIELHRIDKSTLPTDLLELTRFMADRLRAIPQHHREEVLRVLDEELLDDLPSSLLSHPGLQANGGAAYLGALIAGDEELRIVASLRLLEEERFHSFADLLALYNEARELGVSDRFGQRYEELFGRPLDLEQLQITQIAIGYEEDTSETPAKVWVARERLQENINSGELLDEWSLRTVLAHEAEQLAELALEYPERRSRSGSSLQWKPNESYLREKQELEELARRLDTGNGVLPIVVSQSFSEHFSAEKYRVVSQEVWSFAREQRFAAGADGLTPAQSAEARKEVELFLREEMALPEGPILQKLLDHYDSGIKRCNAIFRNMNRVANDLQSGSFGQVITEGSGYDSASELFRSGIDTTVPRDWGYTKDECRALHAVFPDASGGKELDSWLRRFRYSSLANEISSYCFSEELAPEDRDHAKELPYSFQGVEIEHLLQQITVADVETLGAIELRNAFHDEDAFEKILLRLDRGDAHQILVRYQELFGESLLESASQRLLLSADVAVRASQDSNDVVRLNEQVLLEKVVGLVEQLADKQRALRWSEEGTLQYLFSAYGGVQLSRYAAAQAELEAGQLQEGSAKEQCQIHLHEDRLASASQRAARFQDFLGVVLSSVPEEQIRERYEESLRRERSAAVFRNHRTLQTFVMLAEGRLPEQVELHRAALLRYQNTPVYQSVAADPEFQRALQDEESYMQLRNTIEDDYEQAKKAVAHLYAAMKQGWNAVFWADSDKVYEILRGLTPQQRILATELYEVEYQESIRKHFRDEFEKREASRAFAELRGDLSYADYLAIETACEDWFGEEEVVEGILAGVAQRAEETARQELREEAVRLAHLAETLPEGELAQKNAVKAYRCHRAASAEISESSLLQKKIGEVQQRFRDDFDESGQHRGLSFDTLIEEELNDGEVIETVFLQHSSLDTAWAIQFQHALQYGTCDQVAALVRKEREQVLHRALNFEVTLDDQGTVRTEKSESGALLIDGEEITAETVHHFYLDLLTEQYQTLLAHPEEHAAAEELRGQIEEIAAFSADDFASRVFAGFDVKVAEIPDNDNAERTRVLAERARVLFQLLVATDPRNGAPNLPTIERFERYMEREVLQPHYRLALASGAIFRDDEELSLDQKNRYAAVRKQWNDRKDELAKALPDGISLQEQIAEARSGDEQEWLLAELEGAEELAAAHQIRYDILDYGEDLTVAALLPPALVGLRDDIDDELRELEEQLYPNERKAFVDYREQGKDLRLIEMLLIEAVGDKKDDLEEQRKVLTVKLEQQKHELMAQHQRFARYLALLEERGQLSDIIRDRGERIEEIYNTNLASYRTGHKRHRIPMWQHLSHDLGSIQAESYRRAVQLGELTDGLLIQISIGVLGTDEEMLFRAIGDPTRGGRYRTKEELLLLAEDYCQVTGRGDIPEDERFDHLKEMVLGDLDGDDYWKMQVLFVGRPETVDQMREVLHLNLKHVHGARGKWVTDLFVGEGEEFVSQFTEFETVLQKAVDNEKYDELTEEERASRISREEMTHLRAIYQRADITAQTAVERRNVVGEMAVEGVSTVVVVVIAPPLLLGGATLSAVGVAFGSRVGLAAYMKGGSYTVTQGAIDSGQVVLDLASVGVTGRLVTQGVRYGTGKIVSRRAITKISTEAAERQTGRIAAERAAEQAAKSGVAAEGATVADDVVEEVADVAHRHFAGRGGKGVQEYIEHSALWRNVQNVGEGAIEGGFDGLLIGGYQQAFEDETWEDGFLDALYHMSVSGLRHGAYGAGVGAAAAPAFDLAMRGGAAGFRKLSGKKAAPEPAAPTENGDLFVAELAMESSTKELRQAQEKAVRANQRLDAVRHEAREASGEEAASVASRQGREEGELSTADRLRYEVEKGALDRAEKATARSNIDAELERSVFMRGDANALESVLNYQKVRFHFLNALAEQRAYYTLAFQTLFSRKGGIATRFSEAAAAFSEGFRKRAEVRELKKNSKKYRKEVQLHRRVGEEAARNGFSGDRPLRHTIREKRRALQQMWEALRHLEFRDALRHLRTARTELRSQRRRRDLLFVRQEVKHFRSGMKEAAATHATEKLPDRYRTRLSEMERAAIDHHKEALMRECSRWNAWRELFTFTGFRPHAILFAYSLRRARREARRLEQRYFDLAESAGSLRVRLQQTGSHPARADAVIDHHLAQRTAHLARRERRTAARRIAGDFLLLRCPSLPAVFRATAARGRALREVRGLHRTVEEARHTTRLAGLVGGTEHALRIRRDALTPAIFQNDLRFYREPIVISADVVAKVFIGLRIRRYAVTLARFQNDLRFYREPIGSTADLVANVFIGLRARLLGRTPEYRPVRNPFPVVTAFRTFQQSRGIQRALRDGAHQRAVQEAQEVAEAAFTRSWERLGKEAGLERIARNLTDTSRERRFAHHRFRDALRDLRDRLFSGSSAETRSLGESLQAVWDSFEHLRFTRRERARAYDRYRMAQRQQMYERRGIPKEEARERAIREVTSRRRAIRGQASGSQIDLLAMERTVDLYHRTASVLESAGQHIENAVMRPALAIRNRVVALQERISPRRFARESMRSLHDTRREVRAAVAMDLDNTAVDVSFLTHRRQMFQRILRRERFILFLERFGFRTVGSRNRQEFIDLLRRDIEEMRRRTADLAVERGRLRAHHYVGETLDYADADRLAQEAAAGRSPLRQSDEFSSTADHLEVFAQADAELARLSPWNPRHWWTRLRARRRLSEAQYHLFERHAAAERQAWAADRAQHHLNHRERQALPDACRRDEKITSLAEALAEQEAIIRERRQLLLHDSFGRWNRLRRSRSEEIAHHQEVIAEATRRQRELREQLEAEYRVERETARLFAAGGAHPDSATACRNLAEADEALTYERPVAFRDHVRDGGAIDSFPFDDYERRLRRARVEYELAQIRAGRDHYQELAEEADRVAADLERYVEGVSSARTPWGVSRILRDSMRRLRELQEVADFDFETARRLDASPYVIREEGGHGPVLARNDVDPEAYLAQVRQETERTRAQFEAQLREFQHRQSEFDAELALTEGRPSAAALNGKGEGEDSEGNDEIVDFRAERERILPGPGSSPSPTTASPGDEPYVTEFLDPHREAAVQARLERDAALRREGRQVPADGLLTPIRRKVAAFVTALSALTATVPTQAGREARELASGPSASFWMDAQNGGDSMLRQVEDVQIKKSTAQHRSEIESRRMEQGDAEQVERLTTVTDEMAGDMEQVVAHRVVAHANFHAATIVSRAETEGRRRNEFQMEEYVRRRRRRDEELRASRLRPPRHFPPGPGGGSEGGEDRVFAYELYRGDEAKLQLYTGDYFNYLEKAVVDLLFRRPMVRKVQGFLSEYEVTDWTEPRQ
ncbi:hypothetical protein MRY87_06705 [bacterium]|nr:hypothetical protein [bacterium]